MVRWTSPAARRRKPRGVSSSLEDAASALRQLDAEFDQGLGRVGEGWEDCQHLEDRVSVLRLETNCLWAMDAGFKQPRCGRAMTGRAWFRVAVAGGLSFGIG